VHFGALVEGVLGGSQSKAYDVIGDVVNTAQRLCDAAQPWELLVSEPVANLTGLQSAHQRKIQVKGKEQSLTVSVVIV
jgi:class 3 adenylate cyclase